MRKVLVGIVVAIALLLIALVIMVGSVVAEYPWLAYSMPGVVIDGSVVTSTSGTKTVTVGGAAPSGAPARTEVLAFIRRNLRVHVGDRVAFRVTGFHTVTFLPSGKIQWKERLRGEFV